MPQQKKARRTCKNCGKIVAKHSYIYCSNSCQATFQYQHFIGMWLSGSVSATTVAGVSAHVRKYLLLTQGPRCALCSWDKVHPTTRKVPLEIDHIDGDHFNSRPENVRLIRPNCHALTTTFRGLNRGKGRMHRNIRPLSSSGRAPLL